ncbi:DUF1444 family protein [Thermomonospora curvata]|uniref:DUF1444 domain-containing protein n=1 Tax=Thermomonospora curvata (strain ATCC 19995 / DSM 43183 / JCM 3096 / KCTC 9072 / NBRC 15933 / NCIMB 10081 / Henssen B9) TaxID=471852 RepID=D1A9H6_THECD|nr:DUF1444 family protein [Thermomonospora curvata]ACY96872.1 hypothetical protein Tcur_1289 [Thermomonospora curvata DSM 43183]
MMQSRHSAVAPPQPGPLARVVPVMRARVPVAMQLEFPLPDSELPVVEPFVGNLLVGYAIDPPAEAAGGAGSRLLRQLATRHCAELGVAPAELRELAVANLRVLRPDVRFNWYPDVRAVSVTAGGDLEAGLILDEGFVDKLAQDVEGDLVVALPARDVFVATGTGHVDGIDKLRWVVDQIWTDERHLTPQEAAGAPPRGLAAPQRPHLLLTRDLLVRRGGSWQILA